MPNNNKFIEAQMETRKKQKMAESIMNAGKHDEDDMYEVSADVDEVRPANEVKVGAGEVVVQKVKDGQINDEEIDDMAIVLKSKAKVKKVPINLSLKPSTKSKLQKMCKKTKMSNSDFVEQLILQIYDRMMGE